MKVAGKDMRTIWVESDGESLGIIDQTLLPHRFATVRLKTLADAAHAIKSMQVRGAPLIGAAAAYGLWLALREDASDENLERACAALAATRPTAINLQWALDEVAAAVRNRPRAERAAAALARANEIAEEDIAINKALGRHGAKLIADAAARKNGARVNVLTHCNAGWLAAVDYGTALAPVYTAHDGGIAVHVFADETRPRNQGASLTAWELGQHGVPHTVIPDNTGGHLMQHGMVDMVIVGTDRVTAQGDVCNKIGTYLKALAAADNKVPFYVGAPSPSIDFSVSDGISRNPHRAARRRRSRDHDRQDQRRPHRVRADRAGRFGRRQLRLRRHAGAADHRADHRARRPAGNARRPCDGVSRTRPRMIPKSGNRFSDKIMRKTTTNNAKIAS